MLFRGLLAGAPVFVREVAKCLRQEPVLAPEMQVDDALGKARFLGDGCDRGIHQAPVGDAADGGQDQLLAALFRGRGTAIPKHRELSFRAHKKDCLLSKLSVKRARTEAT